MGVVPSAKKRRVILKLRRFTLKTVKDDSDSKKDKGTLGRRNLDGTFTFEVPNKAEFMYVTTRKGTIVEAMNQRVARQATLPVKLIRDDSDKFWVIEGTDNANIASWSGGNTPSYNVPVHSHEAGFMFDPVSMRRMTWAQIKLIAGTLFIQVEEFAYSFDNTLHIYTGGTLDLAAFLPSTPSTWAWVIVTFNPATEELSAITGDEFTGTVYDPLLLDGVVISDGLWALGAVHLRDDSTSILYDNWIYDLRGLLVGDTAGGGGGDDGLFLSWTGGLG